MALTNAERQRRHRAARKKAAIENERLTAELEKATKAFNNIKTALETSRSRLSALEEHWWTLLGKLLRVVR